MFDLSIAAFLYGFLAVAAVTAALVVTAVVVVLRDRTTTPVLVTVSGPSERAYSRAA